MADHLDLAAIELGPTWRSRLWAKVDKNGPVPGHRPDLGPCWVFTGSKSTRGYGTIRVGSRRRGTSRVIRAHRLAWFDINGPIPDAHELDHLCENTSCVNPLHLEPVLHRENVMRGDSPTAENAVKTHCPRGHAYSGDNLTISPTGGRLCKACAREKWRRNNPSAWKLYCKHGHMLAGDNLKIRQSDGARICITCQRERERGYYERHKAAKQAKNRAYYHQHKAATEVA